MSRHLSLICAWLTATAAVAAPVPKVAPDPLPKGATARLGSLAFRGPNLNGLTFSPDGRTLRAAAGWHLLTWDAATGQLLSVTEFTPKATESAEAAGSSAVVGERFVRHVCPLPQRIEDPRECTVVAIDFRADKVVRFTHSARPYSGTLDLASPTWASSSAVSSNGRIAVVCAEDDKTLRVYDLGTGEKLHTFKHDCRYTPGLHISADGKSVLFQEFTKPIRRFDLAAGKPLADIDMPINSSARVETTSDGKRAVIRDRYHLWDQEGNPPTDPDHRTLAVWDLKANESLGKLTLSGTPQHFKCVGAAGLIVVAGECRANYYTRYTVSRWNLDTLKREWEVPCPAADWIAVSPDGKRFALTDRQHVAHLFDAATGKPVAPLAGHAEAVTWVGFSPDGGTVLTADRFDVRAWTQTGINRGVTALTGSGPRADRATGEHLVWSNTDDSKANELVGWDYEQGAAAWRMLLDGPAPDRVYSADGKSAYGLKWDEKAKVWEVSAFDGPSGKRLRQWTTPDLKPHDGPWPIAFCPAAGLVFIGQNEGGTIGLDLASGKEKVRVDVGPVGGGHSSFPFHLAASADGSRLAVVLHDVFGKPNAYTVRIYDVKSGKKLAEHSLDLDREHNGGRQYGRQVMFSPNGKSVAVRGGPGTKVAVCDAESDAKPRVFDGDLSRPTCMAFSPNNATLAVGYQDGTALLWDLTAK